MSPPAKPILEMHGICKRFPGVVALDRVDFDLFPGEVHVLLGENGAGKSTLVKILSGAYSMDTGQIRIDGDPVEIRTPRQAQDIGVSIIYQEFNLVPQLSVAENIFLGREPEIIPGILDRQRLLAEGQRLLSDLGASFSPSATVSALSVAEQQMVEVAKALSFRARILVMDEPTSALTESEIAELFATIRRLKGKGVGVIYISHRLEELFEVGDRVTVLRDGHRVATRRMREVSTPELVRLMADRELKEHFPRQPVEPGEELLRVENLSREGKLHRLSFTLRRGEILGIAGLLGAGRTAMARVIFGADPGSEGRIWIRGKPAVIRSPSSAIRQGIGFLSEDRKRQGLVLALSVGKNVGLASVDRLSRLGFIDGKAEAELARRFVSELRIKTPDLDHKVMYLSGGNQQKVVLAKWLGRQSDILIFDEPTRGIDVGAKVEIYQLMNRLTAEGAGIIMISSELPEILGMSDRILVMRDGRIVAEFLSGEVNQEVVLKAALGQ